MPVAATIGSWAFVIHGGLPRVKDVGLETRDLKFDVMQNMFKKANALNNNAAHAQRTRSKRAANVQRTRSTHAANAKHAAMTDAPFQISQIQDQVIACVYLVFVSL